MSYYKFAHFYQITTFPRFFPINCYLIQEESSLTLIDADIKRTTKEITELINKLALPLTKIIITHGHQDHIGDLQTLKMLYPNVQIYFPATEQEALDQGSMSNLIPLPVPPDFLVKDGDQIGSLTVIETPGHTCGSISLLDRRDQTVFVADLMQSRGGFAISGDTRWLFPFPSFATWQFSTAITSTEKILALKPTKLAFGHGPIVNNPQALLQKLIERAKKKS